MKGPRSQSKKRPAQMVPERGVVTSTIPCGSGLVGIGVENVRQIVRGQSMKDHGRLARTVNSNAVGSAAAFKLDPCGCGRIPGLACSRPGYGAPFCIPSAVEIQQRIKRDGGAR